MTMNTVNVEKPVAKQENAKVAKPTNKVTQQSSKIEFFKPSITPKGRTDLAGLTHAALTILGMYAGKKVSRKAFLGFFSSSSILSYHGKVKAGQKEANLGVSDTQVWLTPTGKAFFKARLTGSATPHIGGEKGIAEQWLGFCKTGKSAFSNGKQLKAVKLTYEV